MYVTVVAGHFLPLKMPAVLGVPPTGVWVVVLLVYAYFASTLPVTTLLQPRDYINAWQLFIAMGLLIVGVFVSAARGNLRIVAPAVNLSPAGAPPIWPFLFVTIACGAISGFHGLVASGTSPKQVSRETDAQFVGYGSMLMEAALATLVIVAVAAGIGMAYEKGDVILSGATAWSEHYASWQAAGGLTDKINAVVVGSANMMTSLGVPRKLGIVIMGVFIASFAGTTLDTATRIQRYVVSELAADFKVSVLANRWVATAFVVVSAGLLAFATGANGTGALKIWPMFGAANQLLAALALMVITMYLRRRRGIGYLVTGIPCLFMLLMTMWAMLYNERDFLKGSNWFLVAANAAVLLLAVWMLVESAIVFLRSGSLRGPEPGAAAKGS